VTPVSSRLVRLLNMVPYFQANPRVGWAEAAADLGVTRKQLQADINQLWMCGLPGYGPGDLIDFEFDDDTIKVTFSAGIDKPLRLNSSEASGLLVALRALADIPGVVDPAAALSAIAKIEAAAGTTTGGAQGGPTTPEGVAPRESDVVAAVREALRGGQAVTLDYYSASRDVMSSRTVDPIRVVLVGDHSYLEAWCRDAEGVRLFRFDRIVDARVLDQPAAAPQPAVKAPVSTALFDADPSLPSATLRVSPRSAWMLEYFPMRVINDLPDGFCEAAMTYAAEDWMARQILGFGADVTVLAPGSLADAVRTAAVDALAAYDALDHERPVSPGSIVDDV
jgi:proteasome accessory factor C